MWWPEEQIDAISFEMWVKGKGSNPPAAVLEAGHNLGIFGVYFSVF